VCAAVQATGFELASLLERCRLTPADQQASHTTIIQRYQDHHALTQHVNTSCLALVVKQPKQEGGQILTEWVKSKDKWKNKRTLFEANTHLLAFICISLFHHCQVLLVAG